MTLFFLNNPSLYGIFNIGTGIARTWNDLVNSIFVALNLKPKIEYINMPEQVRKHYQYYTCADLTKLKKTGYTKQTTSLEEGIKDYVLNYLEANRYLGQ